MPSRDATPFQDLQPPASALATLAFARAFQRRSSAFALQSRLGAGAVGGTGLATASLAESLMARAQLSLTQSHSDWLSAFLSRHRVGLWPLGTPSLRYLHFLRGKSSAPEDEASAEATDLPVRKPLTVRGETRPHVTALAARAAAPSSGLSASAMIGGHRSPQPTPDRAIPVVPVERPAVRRRAPLLPDTLNAANALPAALRLHHTTARSAASMVVEQAPIRSAFPEQAADRVVQRVASPTRRFGQAASEQERPDLPMALSYPPVPLVSWLGQAAPAPDPIGLENAPGFARPIFSPAGSHLLVLPPRVVESVSQPVFERPVQTAFASLPRPAAFSAAREAAGAASAAVTQSRSAATQPLPPTMEKRFPPAAVGMRSAPVVLTGQADAEPPSDSGEAHPAAARRSPLRAAQSALELAQHLFSPSTGSARVAAARPQSRSTVTASASARESLSVRLALPRLRPRTGTVTGAADIEPDTLPQLSRGRRTTQERPATTAVVSRPLGSRIADRAVKSGWGQAASDSQRLSGTQPATAIMPAHRAALSDSLSARVLSFFHRGAANTALPSTPLDAPRQRPSFSDALVFVHDLAMPRTRRDNAPQPAPDMEATPAARPPVSSRSVVSAPALWSRDNAASLFARLVGEQSRPARPRIDSTASDWVSPFPETAEIEGRDTGRLPLERSVSRRQQPISGGAGSRSEEQTINRLPETAQVWSALPPAPGLARQTPYQAFPRRAKLSGPLLTRERFFFGPDRAGIETGIASFPPPSGAPHSRPAFSGTQAAAPGIEPALAQIHRGMAGRTFQPSDMAPQALPEHFAAAAMGLPSRFTAFTSALAVTGRAASTSPPAVSGLRTLDPARKEATPREYARSGRLPLAHVMPGGVVFGGHVDNESRSSGSAAGAVAAPLAALWHRQPAAARLTAEWVSHAVNAWTQTPSVRGAGVPSVAPLPGSRLLEENDSGRALFTPPVLRLLTASQHQRVQEDQGDVRADVFRVSPRVLLGAPHGQASRTNLEETPSVPRFLERWMQTPGARSAQPTRMSAGTNTQRRFIEARPTLTRLAGLEQRRIAATDSRLREIETDTRLEAAQSSDAAWPSGKTTGVRPRRTGPGRDGSRSARFGLGTGRFAEESPIDDGVFSEAVGEVASRTLQSQLLTPLSEFLMAAISRVLAPLAAVGTDSPLQSSVPEADVSSRPFSSRYFSSEESFWPPSLSGGGNPLAGGENQILGVPSSPSLAPPSVAGVATPGTTFPNAGRLPRPARALWGGAGIGRRIGAVRGPAQGPDRPAASEMRAASPLPRLRPVPTSFEGPTLPWDRADVAHDASEEAQSQGRGLPLTQRFEALMAGSSRLTPPDRVRLPRNQPLHVPRMDEHGPAKTGLAFSSLSAALPRRSESGPREPAGAFAPAGRTPNSLSAQVPAMPLPGRQPTGDRQPAGMMHDPLIIQRAVSGAVAAPSQSSPSEQGSAAGAAGAGGADVDELAKEVWSRLRRRLALEAARAGRG